MAAIFFFLEWWLHTASALDQTPLDLRTLRVGQGFTINGRSSGGLAGCWVGDAGDVNGDGISDIILGAKEANANGVERAGQAYVVFGGTDLTNLESLDLGNLSPGQALTLNGMSTGDNAGMSVSGAGDINNDGIDDLVVGAKYVTIEGNEQAGQAYVLFGGPGLTSLGSIDLGTISAGQGLILNGTRVMDFAGKAVSGVGDINADGIDDLLVGAPGADIRDKTDVGQAFIIYGGSSLNDLGSLNLSAITPRQGLKLNGNNPYDYSGEPAVGIGDVNADGIADLLIAAKYAEANGETDAGQAYIVFGGTGLTNLGAIELGALSALRLTLNGVSSLDNLGWSLHGPGDVNADGIDDLIISSRFASPGGRTQAGQVYVVFGNTGLGNLGSMDLGSLSPGLGLTINGASPMDNSGISISGADVNGDGTSDIIIGAESADPSGRSTAGQAYVVFGGSYLTSLASLDLGELKQDQGRVLNGSQARDLTGQSVSGLGDVNGDGIADLIVGAPQADPNPGKAYVIFGTESISTEDPVTESSNNSTSTTTIIIVVVVAVLASVILGVILWYKCGRKQTREPTTKEGTLEEEFKEEQAMVYDDTACVAEEGGIRTGGERDSMLAIFREDEIDVKISDRLGEGHFGMTFKGVIKKTGKVVVIKMPKRRDNQHESLAAELMTMTHLKHPNCLPLLGMVSLDGCMCLVVPFAERGSLDRLHNTEDFRDPLRFKILARDICAGLAFLHGNRIVHRDLACRNILLKADGTALIADYGLSRKLKDTEDYYSAESKFAWMWAAPESLQSRKFDKKSDIWSLGVTFWEVATKGEKPYKRFIAQGGTPREACGLIDNGQLKLIVPSRVARDNPLLATLVNTCLQVDKDARPSVAGLFDNIGIVPSLSSIRGSQGSSLRMPSSTASEGGRTTDSASLSSQCGSGSWQKNAGRSTASGVATSGVKSQATSYGPMPK
eukprot:CAMPEP_0167782256 /NCGR_PEP_ID=MMETSP0111_2-20121227/6411_1 /TAXON_ID=91324 /ORGANISM="Lotharella globosa, Strain CCCM811" /LENGTH=954 /DNA_ID=CAMNT_0007673057 /DNA_START=24 /DNA_END=2888 /DNA_ORIENTATION=+